MTVRQKLALESRVEAILLEAEPYIAQHGGRVTLAEIDQNGVVHLDFGGACQDCVLADLTLNDGLKEMIMLRCPEVTDVVHNAHVGD